MEYIYILAPKNEQNITVFNNILEMFPAILEQKRYRDDIYKKEPGEEAVSPLNPNPVRGGELYLLIKAEKESFNPALMSGVDSPFIFQKSEEVLINFWA